MGLPHSVGNRTVRLQSNHLVLFGDFVEEGVLVVGEERVGHPDLLREVATEG